MNTSRRVGEQASNEHVSTSRGGTGQPRTETGRFESHYQEPRGSAIALRLPQSIDAELRQVVGWESSADNPALKAWVEAAIVEKLQRQRAGGLPESGAPALCSPASEPF